MFKLSTKLALLFSLLIAGADALYAIPMPSGGIAFNDCGTVVSGVSCTLFQADSGPLLLVPGIDSFAEGERVRVQGTLQRDCVTTCLQGDGCVADARLLPGCEPGIDFCNGDGGDSRGCTPCPCGNDAPDGTVGGCLNSLGRSARLIASGVASARQDSLRMELEGGVPESFAILISGDQRLPANPANPCFGLDSGVPSVSFDGLRCVGGRIVRHGARATDGNGDVGATNAGWGGRDEPSRGLIAQGGFTAGQTRNFQVVYREDGLKICQTAQNTSNGVAIQIL